MTLHELFALLDATDRADLPELLHDLQWSDPDAEVIALRILVLTLLIEGASDPPLTISP